MNIIDLVLIYLACGSPIGVYYFVSHQQKENKLLLKSILAAIFWIPFAVKLLHPKITKKLNNKTFQKKENKLRLGELKKIFESCKSQNFEYASLFELREIIERYAGLTDLININNQKITSQEKEFYKVTGNKNAEIQAICLKRRNRRKLILHHTQAREDFLSLIKILLQESKDRKKLANYALEFFDLLNDEKALSSLNLILKEIQQTSEKSFVNKAEKDLWTLQEQKLLKTGQTKLKLQTLTATFNPLEKD